MLLKPATPLTILLLIAFALLVLSVISTPIVKGIPLASFQNVDYGVFGYCKNDRCTNIHIGYTSNEIENTDNNEFNLPTSTRRSLSSILIVHPVAALLTLICLCLATAAHFHGPSHSPRYLLSLLILLLPTLLVTLLAFLVDILLFVPHLGWGGWIVLVATVIHVACGIVTCAMRRTLVSRKARKRRIAENAEMSGENYYNRQNAAAVALSDPKPSHMNAEPKEPVVSSPTADGPTFATFRTNTRESDDDRTPLNGRPAQQPNDFPLTDSRARNNGMPTTTFLRDEPTLPPPPGPYGPDQRGPGGPGGMPPAAGFAPSGRGGYPPRGGGGYGRGGPYGAPRGRGGPMGGGAMGPMRGGPPGMRGRGGGPRGPPPPVEYGLTPGAANYAYDGYGGAAVAPGPRSRPTPPPAGEVYGAYRGGPSPIYRQPSPGPIGMAMSPEPEAIGQAIEMTPQPRQPRRAPSALRESNYTDAPPHALTVDGYTEPTSPSSFYSRTQSYIPPRANWVPAPASPLYETGHPDSLQPEPLQATQPAKAASPSPVYGLANPSPEPVRTNADVTSFYEDADPSFVESRQEPAVSAAPLPSALRPGPAGEPKPMELEDVPEAPGSPTTSEISHFTSISQRPVNPRWVPPTPPVQPAQQKTNMLLENNPDFDLQAGRRRGGAGPGGRMPTLSMVREGK